MNLQLPGSLLENFKSVKKWKYVLRKKQDNAKWPKKKGKKSFFRQESNPGPSACKVNA